MSLPTPLSSTESLAPAQAESQLSWSQQLKERLERLQKPSSPAFELYPGTPVYIARRRLEDTIAATWRAQLLKLVRADLAAGKSGRRKHYWEESQCLVVYELIDGAAALQACPDGASEAAREAYLARTCKDALYVIVPQFAAHTTSAWPSPTRSETKLPASDVHPSLVTPPMSPPLQSAETVDPLSRPSLTQRHTVTKSTSPANSDSSIAEAPVEKLPSPHTLDSIPLHILHPRPLPRHPALILTTPEVADSAPVSDSVDVHREASDNAKSNTSESTTGPTPTSPSPMVPAAASLTSPLSPSMSITPPLSPAPGLGLDIAAHDATVEHEHEHEHDEHEHEDEEEDLEEAAVVTGYWLRPEHFSPTAALAVDLVVDPSPEVQANGHAIEGQEEDDEDVPHVLFKSLNPQLSLDVEVERRSRSNSPALVPVVALEGEVPPSPTLSIGFKELNEHIGLNAEIERISRSPSPVGSIRSVHSHTSFTSDGREVTFKTLNEQFSLDVEAQRRSSLSPMHSPVRSERFVMLQGQDEASPKEEQERSPSPLPSPGEGIAASLAAASFALAATTSGQQDAIENKKDSRALTRTNNQRGLVLRTFILPFSAAYFILNVFNPFSYRSFFALRRQHSPLLPTSSSADTSSQPKLTVGSSKPLLVPRFIWRWAGKDAEYNLARVGLGKGVNTLGARYDGAGGLVDVA